MKYVLLFGIVVVGLIIIVFAMSTNKTKITTDEQYSESQIQNTSIPNTPTPMDKTEESATKAAESVVDNSAVKPTMTTKNKSYAEMPKLTIDTQKVYVATMNTSKGAIKIALDPKDAPNTVNNFIFLAKEGFYNDTPFHRIIKGFMIQGGDPTGTGMGGPGYKFADEKITKEYTRGTIAMANSGPNTNGSQFFIMHADYPLPKNYVIFGKIVDGDEASFKTLDAIATSTVTMSQSGEQSKPTEQILITNITIAQK